jgi:hypothetical protein
MNANETESIKVKGGTVEKVRQHIAVTGQSIMFFCTAAIEEKLIREKVLGRAKTSKIKT